MASAVTALPVASTPQAAALAAAVVSEGARPPATVSAAVAGLRYVSPGGQGIARRRRGRGFVFVDAAGRQVTDAATLQRIASLAIPPAWTDVWIASSPEAHVQATGRDARGRKQYRYHPRWRQTRDETKYARLIAFGRALPRIRQRTSRDLALPGLPRRKVLAALVQLLERTLVRVGNEEYARQNGSYGLTTMQDAHVKIRGAHIEFDFVGKAGVAHRIALDDPRLARVVRHCQDLPGQDLFQYVDETGTPQRVGSSDVNEYLREVSERDFTAKDFRTWAGTVLAARALQEFTRLDSRAATKRQVVRAIESVAARLGNTTAVCRKCYVHPAVVDAYLDGSLADSLSRAAAGELVRRLPKLSQEEVAVLLLIEGRLRADARAGTTAGRRATATGRAARARRPAARRLSARGRRRRGRRSSRATA